MSQFGVPTSEFARTVTVMTVDETPLTVGLAKAENAVTVSAQKMQGSMNKMGTAAAGGFGKAAASIGAFASVSGNAMAGIAAQAVTLGATLLQFATGPWGIALAAAGAIITLIFNAERIIDWVTGVDAAAAAVKKLEEEAAALKKTMAEALAPAEKLVAGFDVSKRRLDIRALGGADVGFDRQRLALERERQNIRAAIDDVRTNVLIDPFERGPVLKQLFGELTRIEEQTRAVGEAEARAAKEATNRLATQTKITQEMKAQQRAGRIAGGGVRTLDEAVEFVTGRLGVRREEQRQSELIARALDSLGFAAITAQKTISGAATTELLAASKFTDIAAARGQLARGPTEDRNLRANERTAKSVEEIARVNARLQEGIETLVTAT